VGDAQQILLDLYIFYPGIHASMSTRRGSPAIPLCSLECQVSSREPSRSRHSHFNEKRKTGSTWQEEASCLIHQSGSLVCFLNADFQANILRNTPSSPSFSIDLPVQEGAGGCYGGPVNMSRHVEFVCMCRQGLVGGRSAVVAPFASVVGLGGGMALFESLMIARSISRKDQTDNGWTFSLISYSVQRCQLGALDPML